MQRTRPPFRADEVGSLLRPQRIKEARAKLEKGEISADELRKIEDVEIEKGNLLVRFKDPDQQVKAADVLRDPLGSDYVVALNLASTAPDWLESIGAKPMLLGLDLQGGVHFMMQVDQKASMEKRLDALAEDVRVQLYWKMPSSERGTFGGVTQVAILCLSRLGKLLKSGEMSEWLKEHAWKAMGPSDTEVPRDT